MSDNIDKMLVDNMLRMLNQDYTKLVESYSTLECGYVRELYGEMLDKILEQIAVFNKWKESLIKNEHLY